jgi:hypothetical protein
VSFVLFLLFLLFIVVPAQADLVILKDGFLLNGKIKQDREIWVDPLTKQWFPVARLNGFYMVDDGARRIIFSASQVADATRQDLYQASDVISIGRIVRLNGGQGLGKYWKVDHASDFNKVRPWERDIVLMTTQGKVRVEQRIVEMSPHHLRLDAKGADWSAYHLTSEFGPDTLRELLNVHVQRPKVKAKLSKDERRFLVFRFLLQTGWYDQAEDELDQILKELPKEKEPVDLSHKTPKKERPEVEKRIESVKEQVESSRKALTKLRALKLADQIELAYRAGQHQKTKRLLTRFAKVKAAPDLIGEQRLAKIQGLEEMYRETDEKIALARKFLRALPKRILRTDHRPIFVAAAKVIQEELHQDTAGRLEGFVGLAIQEERDRKNNRRPKQSPEALMSLAVSGWLMGNDLAETDVPTALALWQARGFVLDYLKAPDRKRLAAFSRKLPVPLDELAQMIRSLPPANPEPMANIQKKGFGIDAPIKASRDDAKTTPYFLQLPPEYHHQRTYPVLLVLHSADGSAKHMLRRWGDLAAQHGYILAAPEWSTGSSEYQYSEEEHARVLDVLRDLRRRFQVDSDRVFLFGFEEGGNMAYDLGLAHPDLFAGVMPMGARPKFFAVHYWPNAQYLPFYVTVGGGDGDNPKINRKQFGDWVRYHYPSLYVEYKGRGPEWFEGELPFLIDWMSSKKRVHPIRQLGKDGGGSIFGQEFRTLREGDKHFYWLSTDAIKPACLNDLQNWKVGRKAAQLTARIGGMNDIYVNTLGLNQVSIWFAPGMLNFEKPVTIRVNGATAWNRKKIKPSLETMCKDLYERGDRQGLYFAKVDFNLH